MGEERTGCKAVPSVSHVGPLAWLCLAQGLPLPPSLHSNYPPSAHLPEASREGRGEKGAGHTPRSTRDWEAVRLQC